MNDAVIRRRTVRALVGVALLYAGLVSTHAGEFWPFSIYQMFSQAGQTWTRVLVREVDPGEALVWHPVPLEDAPGTAFPLRAYGLHTNDLASLVQDPVTPADLAALHSLLAPHSATRPLLVLRATGTLTDHDQVAVQVNPFVLVRSDTFLLPPHQTHTTR